ncbi:MAG: MoxR family ATPase [Clostridia bacterium]|nr:MoxR family ATPase [Clostridia bacterium]
MDNLSQLPKKIVDNMEKVIIGKRQVLELVVISLLASGHVLIEDVPGIGKTSMVSALSKSLGLKFKRIQFTPDILPSDITGFSMYNKHTGDFEFKPGSIMSNIILADEINRTSPKTQASMLEVMEERQVTVDGNTYKLPNPFMVLATQNPVEYLGTYPLPEAQLDRFLMKIAIGYPSQKEEINILNVYKESNPLDTLTKVVSGEDVLKMQQLVKRVKVNDVLNEYVVNIISKTRMHRSVTLGCSPRASLLLIRAAQAKAFIEERDFITPDDIKYLAAAVLSHRLILKQEEQLKNVDPSEIIEDVLKIVKVPIR